MRFRLGTFVEDCGYRNVQPCRKLYRGIMSCGDRPRHPLRFFYDDLHAALFRRPRAQTRQRAPLALALHGERRRYVEILNEIIPDSLRAAQGKYPVVLVAAERVGMADDRDGGAPKFWAGEHPAEFVELRGRFFGYGRAGVVEVHLPVDFGGAVQFLAQLILGERLDVFWFEIRLRKNGIERRRNGRWLLGLPPRFLLSLCLIVGERAIHPLLDFAHPLPKLLVEIGIARRRPRGKARQARYRLARGVGAPWGRGHRVWRRERGRNRFLHRRGSWRLGNGIRRRELRLRPELFAYTGREIPHGDGVNFHRELFGRFRLRRRRKKIEEGTREESSDDDATPSPAPCLARERRTRRRKRKPLHHLRRGNLERRGLRTLQRNERLSRVRRKRRLRERRASGRDSLFGKPYHVAGGLVEARERIGCHLRRCGLRCSNLRLDVPSGGLDASDCRIRRRARRRYSVVCHTRYRRDVRSSSELPGCARCGRNRNFRRGASERRLNSRWAAC